MFSIRPFFIATALLSLSFLGCATSHPSVSHSLNSSSVESLGSVPSIAYEPDAPPMPDASSWIQRAQSGDPTAMFVLHMMYRDNFEAVRQVKAGLFTDSTLDANGMLRERIDWLEKIRDTHLFAAAASRPSLFWVAPEGLTPDPEALNWLLEAAKRGYPNAEYLLGIILWNGIGVVVDKKRGFELIQRAAEHHHSKAQYHLGMIYELGLLDTPNSKLALTWLQKAYENHNHDASFVLFLKYADGIGVAKDENKALEYSNDPYQVWTQFELFKSHDFDRKCTFSYDSAKLIHKGDCNCDEDDDFYTEEMDYMTEEELEASYAAYSQREQLQYTLDYSIDYETASHWLIQAAQVQEYVQSQLLIPMLRESPECRFMDSGTQTSEEILVDMAQRGVPHAKFNLAMFYISQCASDSSLVKRAVEWLKKADAEGYSEASYVLADLHAHERYSYFHNIIGNCDYSEHIPKDYVQSYEYSLKSKDSSRSALFAMLVAKEAHEAQDDAKAVEWLFKVIHTPEDKYISDYISRALIMLAKIYDHGQIQVRDKDKALQYFLQAQDRNLSTALEANLVYLAQLYENGTPKTKPDSKLAIEYYKRSVNAAFNQELDNDLATLIQNATNNLTTLQSLALETAIEDQIRLEQGKDASDNPAIQLALTPCLAHLNQDSDSSCPIIDPMLKESIQNAIAAITALTLAKTGKLNKELISNTYYKTAILMAKNPTNRTLYTKNSQACERIFSARDYHRSEQLDKIYYIWFLNHISRAAAQVFKGLHPSKPWETYITEAQTTMEHDPELQSGFGYPLVW